MPRRRRLSRDEIEEQFGTAGGFTIPLRPSRRSGLIWVGLLAAIAVLALVGGLPGGTVGVDLRRVLEPFPAAEPRGFATLRGGEDVAKDVQTMWRELFVGAKQEFSPAKIVFFSGSAKTDCVEHAATATPGTFYCHADKRLLIDRRLSDGYSIAHGYAHHVQELLGITAQIARAEEASPSQGPDLWRRHELQADCLAGVWAYRRHQPDAALAPSRPTEPDHFIDRESWTAAPQAQRQEWFRRGLADGDPSACDTFSRDA